MGKCLLSAIKPRRPPGGDDLVVVEKPGSAQTVYPSYYEDEPGSARKVYPSDYDKRHGMVGDPKVNDRAEYFIKRVCLNHDIKASGSQTMGELQTVTVYSAKN